MPPEYLTVQEAKRMQEAMAREFGMLRIEVKEISDAVADMAVDNAKRDGRIEGVMGAVQRIEAAVRDRTQLRWTVAFLAFNTLVTVGVAVWAKTP